MGYNRNDFAGVLLSLEALAEANRKAEAYSKSNRAKQSGRRSKVPTRKPRRKR